MYLTFLNMPDPVNIDNVDVSELDLRYFEIKDSTYGKMYHVLHKGVKLQILLPKMNAPFGASVSDKFGLKVSLPLSFKNIDEDTKEGRSVKRAFEKLEVIDNRLREIIVEKKDEIFKDKKKVPKDVLEDRYKSFITPSSQSNGKEYPARINPKILLRKNISEQESKGKSREEIENLKKKFVSMIGAPLLVDKKNQEINVDLDNIKDVIPWGSTVKAVVNFSYIWVSTSQECSPVLNFVHGLVAHTKPQSTFNMLDGEVSEEENDKENDQDDEQFEITDDEEDQVMGSSK